MTATLKARFLSASAYARPVIPLTLSLIAGIVIGLKWPGGEAAALAVIGGSGAVIVRCLACRRPAAFSPLILFVALGYLSLQPYTAPRFPSDHVSRFLDTGPWEITGVVDGRPTEYESRTRFVVTTERRRAARIPPGLRPAAGDSGRPGCRGRPRRPHRLPQPDPAHSASFNNPGGFDAARHMHLQGVWGSASTDAGAVGAAGAAEAACAVSSCRPHGRGPPGR